MTTTSHQSPVASFAPPSATAQPPLGTVLAMFDRALRTEYAEGSREPSNIRAHLRGLPLCWLDVPVDHIRPAAIKAWLQEVAPGTTRKYANKRLQILKRMINWAAELEIVCPTVAATFNLIKPLKYGQAGATEERAKQPVSWKAVKQTIERLNPETADMVKVHWLTGCRASEITAMTREETTERPDGNGAIYRPKLHKTVHKGMQRAILIGPKAWKVAKPYWLKTETGRIWPCRSTNTYLLAIRRAQRRWKLEKWAPGQIRHSFATRVANKFRMEDASMLLGHADLRTTRRYAHLSLEGAEKIIAQIG